MVAGWKVLTYRPNLKGTRASYQLTISPPPDYSDFNFTVSDFFRKESILNFPNSENFRICAKKLASDRPKKMLELNISQRQNSSEFFVVNQIILQKWAPHVQIASSLQQLWFDSTLWPFAACHSLSPLFSVQSSNCPIKKSPKSPKNISK